MVQIYFEAPHSDTRILGQCDTCNTQKHKLADLRPYSTHAQDKNHARWHQQCFNPNPSSQAPTNSGSISHVLAHVSPDQLPFGLAGHAHEISHFADISSYPRPPSLCHPRLHRNRYQNTTGQYERGTVSTAHQKFY